VEEVSPPAVVNALDVRELITQPSRHEHASRCYQWTVRTEDLQSSRHPADAGDEPVDHPAPVARDLSSASGEELRGRKAISGQEAVHVRGGCVSRLAAVDDDHAAAGPSQDERSGQASRSPTDDRDVAVIHDDEVAGRRGRSPTVVAKPGIVAFAHWVDRAEAIAATLDLVGPRLRQVRAARQLTLTDLATRTGISKSTRSRLENGQRRPTLELLLALADAYRVPLDDLVGAPETGDPRIRLKPRRVHGRTVVPLTQGPTGVQAWKMILPPGEKPAKLRTHDGHEWMYVLTGRMRLFLGDKELVLGVGDAIEFDTATPHWFCSADSNPAEVLSLFGRPGEQMKMRHSTNGHPRASAQEGYIQPETVPSQGSGSDAATSLRGN
jgi:transcriptional regulator with XRE-family HTH domain